jgi:hypothetical protein
MPQFRLVLADTSIEHCTHSGCIMSSPVVLKECVCVCGGDLKEPVIANTKMHGGDQFIRIRQYDTWLAKVVGHRSVQSNAIMAKSNLWNILTGAVPALVDDSGSSKNSDDPLASYMPSRQPTKKYKKAPSRDWSQAENVQVPKTYGAPEQQSVQVLLCEKDRKKTVWIKTADFAWALAYLRGELRNSAALEDTPGLRWRSGSSLWVFTWHDADTNRPRQVPTFCIQITSACTKHTV